MCFWQGIDGQSGMHAVPVLLRSMSMGSSMTSLAHAAASITEQPTSSVQLPSAARQSTWLMTTCSPGRTASA